MRGHGKVTQSHVVPIDLTVYPLHASLYSLYRGLGHSSYSSSVVVFFIRVVVIIVLFLGVVAVVSIKGPAKFQRVAKGRLVWNVGTRAHSHG